MTMISHDGTALSKFTTSRFGKFLSKTLAEYLGGCNRQGLEWLFDQLASNSVTILLLLAGYISEATNWF